MTRLVPVSRVTSVRWRPGPCPPPLARDVTDSTNINFTIGHEARPATFNEFINYFNSQSHSQLQLLKPIDVEMLDFYSDSNKMVP